MRSPKLLFAFGVVAGAMLLTGCSSMSASECVATDWRTVGYEDGVAGYTGDRISRYRKTCGKHGIAPDLAAYQAGREQGLREFCKPQNGFRVGARGNGYSGVCPAELDAAFMGAYETGRQLYTLRSRVGSTQNEIASMRSEMDRIDKDLVSIGAQILDSSLTREYRAQLVVDSKHLAERRGELKTRIPQIEGDLLIYQRELDDYRSTLAYIE